MEFLGAAFSKKLVRFLLFRSLNAICVGRYSLEITFAARKH